MVLTHNAPVQVNSALLDRLIGAGPFGVPVLAYLLLATACVFVVAIHCTPFGLRLHAVGSHPGAAQAEGIGVSRYVAVSYVISGVSAGIAALASSALLSGSAPGAGENLLAVVAAALLGAVFSRRLIAGIPGTLLSVLFVGLIANGFQLINVSSYWINGVEGALILFVVALIAMTRRQAQRMHRARATPPAGPRGDHPSTEQAHA